MTAQNLSIGETDPANAETVHDAIECGVRSAVSGGLQVFVALFAEAVHRDNLVPVAIKVENVRIGVDKAMPDELLERLIRQTIHIQRVAAHEQREILDLLCRAFRVRAIQELRVLLLPDLGRCAAGRADFRGLQRRRFRKIFRDLRDDHVRLVDRDVITKAKLHVLAIRNVMKACAGNGRALKLNRVENCDRIDEAGPARGPFNVAKHRFRLLIGPFERDRVPWELRRRAERLAVCDVVEQKNQAVGREVIVLDFFGKPLYGFRQCLLRDALVADDVEAERGQEFKLLFP